MSESKPAPQVLSAADLWWLSTFPAEVGTGPGGRPLVVRIRRADPLTMLMEGWIQHPLLAKALEILAEVKAWVDNGDDVESIFARLDEEKRTTLLDRLHAYACRFVVEPKLVAAPTGAPDEFPVTLLSTEVLWAIWNAVPPDVQLPRLTEAAAADFRGPAAGAAPAAGSDGAGVRPATLVLAPDGGATGDA